MPSGVRWSGWPIPPSDLEDFYTQAQEICNLGVMRYDDVEYWARRAGRPRRPTSAQADLTPLLL